MKEAEPTYLYRCYTRDGKLLYIGASMSPRVRLAAERAAIRRWKPRFNIAHTSSTEPVGLRLPHDVMAWLRRRGKEEQRSMAFIAAQAIREAMERETAAKKRKSKTP